MKNRIHILLAVLALSFTAAAAEAACYADYKAKKSNPLKLHYGVIELPDAACKNRKTAADAISSRIASGGWTLLNVMSTFGAEGLDARKQSAGNFYLKY